MLRTHESIPPVAQPERTGMIPEAEIPFKLCRWLVHFRSGTEWYVVGEYVAPSPERAIERAVEVLGAADECRAEEIPWDAAPLSKWSRGRNG